MGTPYGTIYNWFLNKVKYYSLSMFTDAEKNEIVYSYMRSACAKFISCEQNLSDRDDDFQEFNIDLDDEILDIISENMVADWLQPKLNNEENLVNSLSTKDYSLYSPGNLLDKITNVYKLAKKNSKNMMSNYSFNHGKLPRRYS